MRIYMCTTGYFGMERGRDRSLVEDLCQICLNDESTNVVAYCCPADDALRSGIEASLSCFRVGRYVEGNVPPGPGGSFPKMDRCLPGMLRWLDPPFTMSQLLTSGSGLSSNIARHEYISSISRCHYRAGVTSGTFGTKSPSK